MWAVEIDLIAVWRIRLDLISVSGSELTWVCVGVENDLFLVSGSKIGWFVCRGIQINLILEWVSIDLISVAASKLT